MPQSATAAASSRHRSRKARSRADRGHLGRVHSLLVLLCTVACRRVGAEPWWFDSIFHRRHHGGRAGQHAGARSVAFRASTQSSMLTLQDRIVPSLNDLIYWPYRCASVCLGTVDVYRRSCCCYPIVFDDPRIDDLIRDLEIYVERLPKLPPPKRRLPPPPPPPLGDRCRHHSSRVEA